MYHLHFLKSYLMCPAFYLPYLWGYLDYTVWPKFCGHQIITPLWAFWTTHSKTRCSNMELPSFVATAASTLLGRLSSKVWSLSLECVCGNLFPLSQKSIYEVRYSCKIKKKPGSQSRFWFIPNVVSMVEFRALCWTPHFLNTKLIKSCL